MVTKRIRSEYMKKFKDPKWETYGKCYEEMLMYRLTRRLLEHTHNPWFWNGSDSDSDSGGRSPPPPGKNQVGSVATGARTRTELDECEGARSERQSRSPRTVSGGPLRQEEQDASAVQGSQLEGARETRGEEGEEEQRMASSRGSKQISLPLREQDHEADAAGPRPQHSKPSKSSKPTWRSQRVRPVSSRQPGKDNKGIRHPFALYGSGEKDADIAGRRTHNVRPAASTSEIHESALRAKTRREVERKLQTQRTEHWRAKSADLDKARRLVQPEYNPWLTEYMRCFSARSR